MQKAPFPALKPTLVCILVFCYICPISPFSYQMMLFSKREKKFPNYRFAFSGFRDIQCDSHDSELATPKAIIYKQKQSDEQMSFLFLGRKSALLSSIVDSICSKLQMSDSCRSSAQNSVQKGPKRFVFPSLRRLNFDIRVFRPAEKRVKRARKG